MSENLFLEMDLDSFRKRLLKYTRRAFKSLPKLDKPRVLDVGCGSGVVTIELARLSNGEVTGIDAANRFEKQPSDGEMKAIVDEFDMRQIFPRVPHRSRGKGPQTWGGQMSKALQGLVREGYFKHPNKRTFEHIVKALESRNILTKDKEGNIRNSLAGRVKKGILKRGKTPDRGIFWAE